MLQGVLLAPPAHRFSFGERHVHHPADRVRHCLGIFRRAGDATAALRHEAICAWARERGLGTHLDGARLFNAVVASGIAAADWAQHFDTVSICFSKGLGAPVGSALLGTREQIRKARRHRKVLGGGMRQAGILAAAAHYALEHHVERLADDHAMARRLGEAISALDGLSLTSGDVATNMVIFQVAPELGTAAEFAARLDAEGARMLAIGPREIRAVTHLDLPPEADRRAAEILAGVVQAS